MEAGSTQLGSGTPGGHRPLGVKRRRWGEEVIRALLFLAAAISILTTIGIVIALLAESIPFFVDVGSKFFTDGSWSPLFADPEFGVWQLLNGTFLITGIAILVAIPIGLASAIYLSEYASPQGPKDHQADPRGPRRGPDGRVRLLRPRPSSRRRSSRRSASR